MVFVSYNKYSKTESAIRVNRLRLCVACRLIAFIEFIVLIVLFKILTTASYRLIVLSFLSSK
jgi:hypothetical protein